MLHESYKINRLIEIEKQNIKAFAVTSSIFAMATGGELILSMFNPKLSNFIVTGGFAIFSGANAYWMHKHYNKKREYEEKEKQLIKK
ncbi:MAG: hypothetical protein IKG40_00470 [Bacilli bacterium]|nr:hypothetical protein [Bacilli bacterium]